MSNIVAIDKMHLKLMILNRPEALNSLDWGMVDDLRGNLESSAADSSVKAVLFKGAGDKAFCAGGDIKAARLGAIAVREGKMPLRQIHDFFRDEYALNKQIFHYEKPTISFMNGITMGGGVGIAGPCRYRIATEKTVWAMPEVSIGFFPDVGAAYYLSRAPNRVGRYPALTGMHISNAGDLIKCGFATDFVPINKEELLIITLSNGDAETALLRFCEPPPEPALPYDKIESCFDADSVEEILANLQKDGSEWALQTHALIGAKSPTSLKVSLRHVIMAEEQSFDESIARDLVLAGHFLEGNDLIEGVRAMVVDKDKAPKWNPASLGDVGKDAIEAFFNQNLGLVD